MPPEEPTAPVEQAPAALPVTEAVTIISPVAEPTPVSAPETVVTAEPSAEVVAEPVVEPVAVPEAVVEPTSTTEKTAEEPKSLLEEAGKTTEEPKKTEATEKPAAEAAEPVKYEAFKLPEGVPVDEARINAFQEIVGPAKLDQETAQKLVDLHATTIQAMQQHLVQAQIDAFAETRRQWREKSMADEQIGGSGHQTAMRAAARMRDLLVGDGMKAEFAQFLADTGVGDHPVMIKIFHNAARLFDEPAAPPIQARPVPDRGGPGKPSKGAAIYDHPSSRKAAGR